MPCYAASKIYAITVPKSNLMYVGSTTKQYLCQRFSHHMWMYRNGYCSTLRELMNTPGAKIELIEEWPCTCVSELRQREQHWIDVMEEHGRQLVNQVRAFKRV